MLRNIFVVGNDGKTAWHRARGTPCGLMFLQFGEIARYKCRSKEGGIGGSGDHWGVGLWLGVESKTGQHILFDPVQGGIRHARTLMRLPDGQKFDNDRAAAVSMTPFSTHAADRPRGVFAEKLVDPAEVNPDVVAKVRGIYIKKEDLDAFGFTPGCICRRMNPSPGFYFLWSCRCSFCCTSCRCSCGSRCSSTPTAR